nr:hypothetical protein [Tanacetum cinerariifolium]
MELYMQNKEHERMILESIEHGPLIWPTIKENGLPSDVYSLVSHHRVAKDLWERVQLLMQVLVVAAPRAVDLADSPVSTSINKDAPSTSIPSTQDQEHSPIISQGFEESPKIPHFHNDQFHESFHEDLTS